MKKIGPKHFVRLRELAATLAVKAADLAILDADCHALRQRMNRAVIDALIAAGAPVTSIVDDSTGEIRPAPPPPPGAAKNGAPTR